MRIPYIWGKKGIKRSFRAVFNFCLLSKRTQFFHLKAIKSPVFDTIETQNVSFLMINPIVLHAKTIGIWVQFGCY